MRRSTASALLRAAPARSPSPQAQTQRASSPAPFCLLPRLPSQHHGDGLTVLQAGLSLLPQPPKKLGLQAHDTRLTHRLGRPPTSPTRKPGSHPGAAASLPITALHGLPSPARTRRPLATSDARHRPPGLLCCSCSLAQDALPCPQVHPGFAESGVDLVPGSALTWLVLSERVPPSTSILLAPVPTDPRPPAGVAQANPDKNR